MDAVFDVFPNAIVKDDWKLGQLIENTDVGKTYNDFGFKDVIVDEEASGELDVAPTAEGIETGTLLYARPEQMPSLNIAELIASFYWYQKSAGQFYRIIRVGIGKNQETGTIEHIEFDIKPTEFAGEYHGES